MGVVFKNGVMSSNLGQNITEREIERFIGDALGSCILVEEYPRTAIEIVIQVIKEDGSVISTALNAAVLALMDAGVQMKYLSIATTCLVENRRELNLRLDPCEEEEYNDDCALIVLVTTNVGSGVITSLTLGDFKQESYLVCIESALRASKAVLEFMRMAIKQKSIREGQTLWS